MANGQYHEASYYCCRGENVVAVEVAGEMVGHAFALLLVVVAD